MNARDHFLMLARYHAWATEHLLDRHVAKLSDDEYRRDVGLFFNSVHGTLNHLLLTDHHLWFERFANGTSPNRKLNEEVHADRAQLAAAMRAASRAWVPAIESWPAARFDGPLAYTSTDGKSRSVPFTAALSHAFNHGTHHRGQITAAITMLGHECPEIDLLIPVLYGTAGKTPP
ncbi:MAG: DinB family protein [Burkholderiaceae bacterium]